MEQLTKISVQQQLTIDPDAVFGIVDPRDSNNVRLKEIFVATVPSQHREYNKDRGSSAKQWNDTIEFATPNLLQKADEKGYVIGMNNFNSITSFNPFEIP